VHGFSATRQEIAPVPERVAAALGANLFETRLAGHGRERDGLVDVRAEEWLDDGRELLGVGRALGERLTLIGTSTGATLALALASHPDFRVVDSLVLISPNFGPAPPGAGIMTGPFGPQLTRTLVGPYNEWPAANDLQARYWTTRYPSAALVEMMRLVQLARRQLPQAQVNSALLVYSPGDDVVSVPRLLAAFDALPAARKEVLRIDAPRSLSRHVLAGDILAPAETPWVARAITDFLLGTTGR
jgi:pimeloyl-ACP methyl ester carboxylesterase